MDIVGPLQRTKQGNKYVLTFMDSRGPLHKTMQSLWQRHSVHKARATVVHVRPHEDILGIDCIQTSPPNKWHVGTVPCNPQIHDQEIKPRLRRISGSSTCHMPVLLFATQHILQQDTPHFSSCLDGMCGDHSLCYMNC